MTGTELGATKRVTPENYSNGSTPSLDDDHNIKDGIEQSEGDSESDYDYGTDTSCNGDDFDKTVYNGGPLWLGFVEKTKKRSCFSRHLFPSKAGGTPAWLDPIHLPTGRSFVCGFCEEPLQFVLQVYAPIIESESAYHRSVFVFMCPSMKCLRLDQHEQQKQGQEDVPRSMKVFRCQLPLVNPFYKCKNQTNDGSSSHSETEAALCSWCGTWKGSKLCSGCRGVKYCSKKHQVLHWRSYHGADCKRMSGTCPVDGECASETTHKVASNTLWPEFKIILEQSRESSESVSDCNDTSNSLASDNGVHSSLMSDEADDETPESFSNYFETDEEKKSLASFVTHTSKDPDQVLRCWLSDGKPLWPELKGRPSKTDIPKCTYCSGPMRFEFQILPQLLFYFNVDNDVDSLDWATIAIYTCEASCDSPAVYKEEFPWVQLYT